MGLLDNAPSSEGASQEPCLLGRILLRQELNGAGKALELSDVTELVKRRLKLKHGAPRLTKALRNANFKIARATITLHLSGTCSCPPGTPMLPGVMSEPDS